MACLPVPKLPVPTLPSPFHIEPPPLPSISVSLALCCKLPPLATPPIPIPLSATILTPAVLALIITATQTINGYLDALPLSCPFD